MLRLKIYVKFIHIYIYTYIYIHTYIHIYIFCIFLGDVKMYFYGLRWQVGVVIVLLSGMNVYFRFFFVCRSLFVGFSPFFPITYSLFENCFACGYYDLFIL